MKKLIIAEKPSVGKDIARALGLAQGGNGYFSGKDYTVTWAMGHLVTLKDPESYDERYQKWTLDNLPIIPPKMGLAVIPQTRKQFNTIKVLTQQASEIIIATDAGREGELVARWILDYIGCKLPIKRLWISSVTDRAIKDGFANLRDGRDYLNLYHSAYARAVADWLVGINATRALTAKHNASLSCGRVQTPTLQLIAKREESIRTFVPKTYYELKLTHSNTTFNLNAERMFDKQQAENLRDTLSKVTVTAIASTTKKSTIQGYDLTTLQQDANRLYDLSAKETLVATQSLYERHKAVTYPRTDSNHITTDMVDTLADRVRAVNFSTYSPVAKKILVNKITPKGFVNDQLVTDHHAIIPTEEAIDFSDLNNNERRVYDLIVKRFLAVLLPPYAYEQTKITATDSTGKYTFTAKGNRTLDLGYKEVYTKATDMESDDDSDAGELPVFTKGQPLGSDIKLQEGKTTPPSYYTEGTLLKDMDRLNLGTVATRADIIDKLHNSANIEKDNKYMRSTGKARQLLELVPRELRSPELTAKWEYTLGEIAAGKQNKDTFLNDIKAYTHQIIGDIRASDAIFKHTNMTSHRCPTCQKNMLEIKGKKGTYLLCQDRECGERKNLEITTNARCPKCKKRLSLVGDKHKKQSFVCHCGHRESKEAFDERRKREGDKLSKRDVQKYLAKQNDKDFKNNALADQLKGFTFD